MTTHKPYQAALSLDQAYAEISQKSGDRYDPDVVEAFRRAWRAGRIQTVRVEWEQTPKTP